MNALLLVKYKTKTHYFFYEIKKNDIKLYFNGLIICLYNVIRYITVLY